MLRFSAFAALFLTAQSLLAAGTALPPVSLQDYRGKAVSTDDYADAKGFVVAFLGTECPLAKLYGPRLQQVADKFRDRGIVVLGINSNQQDSVTEIGAYVRQHGIQFPMLKDPGNKVADSFHADRTPEVFLLDAERNVVYRGRVDDQYVVGIQRDKADRADLELAIEDLLAGREIAVPVTQALGCLIGKVRKADESSTVTYSNQIARIFQKRCEECHRSGEIAPFTLQSYDDVVGWGEMIGEVVGNRRMPPWTADAPHGSFANDRSLPDDEREMILTWVKNGCPRGNPKDLPEPRTFVDGWQLSRLPEAVFNMRGKPFDVPADAGPEGVKYQNFWVDPKFKEDKWISEIEVQPGNRAIVHHIIVYVHPEGRGSKEVFLAAYVPGLRARAALPGSGKKIPAGSQFRFQVHYTPNGSPQQDLSRVGMNFADPASIENQIITTEVANARFELKPNTDDQVVTARSKPSPVPVTLLSMSPHMHLRGKSFKYELKSPDGESKTLLNVPRYDFNWQGPYILPEPLTVPAGAWLECTATFDNSSKNLANPDPSKTVRWGDQSWEEMMIGYFDIMLPREVNTSQGGRNKPLSTQVAAIKPEAILEALDANGDGSVSKAEAKGNPIVERAFKVVDADGNGALSLKEISDALERLKKGR